MWYHGISSSTVCILKAIVNPSQKSADKAKSLGNAVKGRNNSEDWSLHMHGWVSCFLSAYEICIKCVMHFVGW